MELALAHLSRAKALAAGTTHVELAVPDRIRLARTDFGAFCSVFNKPPADHHRAWHEEIITGNSTSQLLNIGGPNLAILAPRGPLAYGTSVLTPGCWRPIEELATGDSVFADDGSQCLVTSVQDYGEQECFRVDFSDGTHMICDDSHRFDVRISGLANSWRTATLQQLRLMKPVSGPGAGRWRWARSGEATYLRPNGYPRYVVPVAAPVDFEEQDFVLDPYLLGCLLGDGGYSNAKGGRVVLTSADIDIVDEIRLRLPEGIVAKKGPGKYSWVFVSDQPGWSRNNLITIMNSLGLMGKRAEEKRVPECYFWGSAKQRLELLQGLLDTDGGGASAGRQKPGVLFGSASRGLCQDVVRLARSLGCIAREHGPCQAHYRDDAGERVVCQPSYRCYLSFPAGVLPYRCKRKLEGYRQPLASSNGGIKRTITAITPVGARPVRCISVDHSSERFLVDDCVVSKNSAKSTALSLLSAWIIGIHTQHKMLLRMLYLGYSLDIARSRSHTIKAIIGSQKYREIFPMVQLSKVRQSDELWGLDMDFAGIEPDGDDPYTLVAQGLSGSITSRRSQLIVLDDVLKSSEAIQNPAIRKKLITNWSEVVQPTLLEGGRAIALGTRFTAADIFATTFNEKNGWRVKTQQAIVTDANGIEKSYWPEMYSLEHLRKLRREDPISFSYQFQNKPVSQSEIDFPEDWLKLGDISNSYDAVGIGIDLSSALKERSDWTVFLLLGRIDDRIECIDYRRLRAMGNLEKIEALCEMLLDWGIIELEEEDGGRTRKWYPTDVGVQAMVEAIAYQQSLKADAEAVIQQERGLHNIRFKPITSWRGDKLTRLRGTFGLFQSGRITWNRFINWEPFWSELLNYGNADHDDCPDALVIGLKGVVGAGQLQTAWDEWEGLD